MSITFAMEAVSSQMSLGDATLHLQRIVLCGKEQSVIWLNKLEYGRLSLNSLRLYLLTIFCLLKMIPDSKL